MAATLQGEASCFSVPVEGSCLPKQLRAWVPLGTLNLGCVALGQLLLIYPTWKTDMIIAPTSFGLLSKVNLGQ